MKISVGLEAEVVVSERSEPATRLSVSHLLTEPEGGPPLIALGITGPPSSSSKLAVARTGETAGSIVVGGALYTIAESLGRAGSLLLPIVIDVISALRSSPADIGLPWIVLGQGPHSWVADSAALSAGARSVLRGPTEAWKDDLSEYLGRGTGQVQVIDASSRHDGLAETLSLLPRDSSVLIRGTSGDRGSINFYADVHAKNVSLVGWGDCDDPKLLGQALRFLRARIGLEGVSAAIARAEAVHQDRGPVVVEWPARLEELEVSDREVEAVD